ncbi:MAG: class I SAM-dependent methyltransferase [Lachnospiraceae bacterium]|nr:class I SAM-dependent methyltransferase [Lachnospiraceae bacterium]
MCKCLVCGNKAERVISFGDMPIANGFLSEDMFEKEKFYPLEVGFCPTCSMVQLTELVDKEDMFNENYAYFASTSKRMVDHFKEFAYWVMENYLSDNPFVVEIGSNDGIMLQNYVKENIKHVGVEPSENVAQAARDKGVNTLSCFFDKENAEKIKAEYGEADVIAGTNVMCHLPYIHSVFDGVTSLLKPQGVLIFEDPYVGDIVRRTSYDQIYDEHAFYFSVSSVSYLADMHGLEVIDALPQNVHGGSMRYILARRGARKASERVREIMADEEKQGLKKLSTYQAFAGNVAQNKEDLLSLLKKIKSEGKRIVGYGATSKSTTVLNYCGIGPEYIEFISDTTPIKQGKFTPGMHIPVKPYDAFAVDYPEYALLFAWNHGEEIIANESSFQDAGGKFILYVDRVRVDE